MPCGSWSTDLAAVHLPRLWQDAGCRGCRDPDLSARDRTAEFPPFIACAVLHRKLVVIDGKVAFIRWYQHHRRHGYARARLAGRNRLRVRVTGAVVAIHPPWPHISFWALVRWPTSITGSGPRPTPAVAAPTGNVEAALVLRDNVRHRRDIEEAYLDAIEQAQDELVLASAYFPARHNAFAMRCWRLRSGACA